MVDNPRDNNLPILLEKIRSLNFTNNIDQEEIINLSKSILEELEIIKSRFRSTISNDSDIDKQLWAEYEAEEEIVVGLLFLLQEKVINYIFHPKI